MKLVLLTRNLINRLVLHRLKIIRFFSEIVSRVSPLIGFPSHFISMMIVIKKNYLLKKRVVQVLKVVGPNSRNTTKTLRERSSELKFFTT